MRVLTLCAVAALTLGPACGREVVLRQPEPVVIDRTVEVLPAVTPVPSKPATATRPVPPAHRVEPPARPAPGSAAHGQSVLMSWYAEGSGTASGEPLRVDKPNCAAASRFPLRSKLNLRNPNNGKRLRVWLNDRGAFEKWGRSLDCVPYVWRALGYSLSSGVVRVEITA